MIIPGDEIKFGITVLCFLDVLVLHHHDLLPPITNIAVIPL